MSDFAARIRRVRMKGGADVSILRTAPTLPDGDENWNGKIVGNAKGIAEAGRITGYMVLAVYDDGSHNCAFRISHDECSVPMTLWPSWIAEIARRYVVTKTEAEDMFHEMFEWREG